jgi:uncharacterized protein
MNYRKIFENWQVAFGYITMALLVVAVLLSAYLVSVTLNVWDDPYINSISVTGKGEVIVIPNIASFDFTVTEASESVDTAQNMAGEKIGKALDYLKKNGVEEKDLKTAGYNIYPKYQWVKDWKCSTEYCPGGRNEIIAYEVSQTVTVKIRETQKAGELLSGVGAVGISNISGLNFTTDDPDSIRELAKKEAIKNAKEKAAVIEKELGIRLGKIISFGEDQGYYPVDGRGYGSAESVMMKSDMMIQEVPAGEEVVSYTVYISYEIK